MEERLQRYQQSHNSEGCKAQAKSGGGTSNGTCKDKVGNGGEGSCGGESIYTILIHFPSSKSNCSLPTTNTSASASSSAMSSYCQHHKDAAGSGGGGGSGNDSQQRLSRRVPSIQMIPAAPGHAPVSARGSSGSSSSSSRHYARSLPITRRNGDGSGGDGGGGGHGSHFVRQSSSTKSTTTSVSCSPGDSVCRRQQQQKLPLDTKLVPKQLLRDHYHQQHAGAGETYSTGSGGLGKTFIDIEFSPEGVN